MSEVSPPGQLNEGPLNSTLTLAPLPVDTNAKANDGRGLISYKDEAVLELGGNETNLVAGYQMLISILNIFNAVILFSFIVLLGYCLFAWGGGYLDSVIICLITMAVLNGLVIGPWIYSDIKDKKNWPVRFHRQRREVAVAAWTCDNSKKQQQYFYIPWEQLNASLLQSKNVATTGVTETLSLNLWFKDKASGKQIQAKFDLGSAALVLGLWESIRAFMEKGPEYCPMDWYSRQNKDKSLMAMTLEGYQALAQHYKKRYTRNKLTFWEYYYGFHFKQWCQGGTIPYRLSDWHHKRGDMIRKKLLPKDTAWGKPLPQSQWAQPSAALQDMNTFLYKVYEPGGVSFMEAMVKWQEHCSAKHERKKRVSDQV